MITKPAITPEDFSSLETYRNKPQYDLKWELVFTLPAWLRVWWQNFGSGAELYVRAVRQGDKILGIAPLQIRDGQASIIGSVNVCDYQDFITSPGSEMEFFSAILEDLKQKGVRSLNLESLRPDSSAINFLIPLAKGHNYEIKYHQSDVSLDMELPADWEQYLSRLDGKQRHEIRRKMRNLQGAGESHYRVIKDKKAIPEALSTFLRLFPDYRADKAEFLTTEMQAFFRDLTDAMADPGIIRFGFLDLGSQVVAMVMYFEYNESIYLYNSAYDPNFQNLSVGIISKAKCIEDSIEKRKKKFDFLKGSEKYKYYLGGKEIPLYDYTITIQ